MSTTEQWRPSPSLPEYEVSSWGRVRRVPYKAPMPGGGVRTYGGIPHYGQDANGRMIFTFRQKTYKVHRLICEAFNGPPPPGKNVCMHLDEDYRNNRPENLKWGTQKENLNAPKFIEYCKSRTGENSPWTKGMRKKQIIS